jgi:hypothetical protein
VDLLFLTAILSKADVWIRKRSQPLLTQKNSTKQLPKVARGFVNAYSLCDSEIVNENLVTADSEIITETSSKGDAWIRKCSKPNWLRKGQRKWSRCRLGNRHRKTLEMCRLENHHRNTFQRWSVDLEELTTPVDLEKLNDNGVGADWEIITETPSKADAWIQAELVA